MMQDTICCGSDGHGSPLQPTSHDLHVGLAHRGESKLRIGSIVVPFWISTHIYIYIFIYLFVYLFVYLCIYLESYKVLLSLNP